MKLVFHFEDNEEQILTNIGIANAIMGVKELCLEDVQEIAEHLMVCIKCWEQKIRSNNYEKI